MRYAVILLAAMIALLVEVNSTSAEPFTPKAIPDMYVGTWWHHGASLEVVRFDEPYDNYGQVIGQWRTYKCVRISAIKAQ